MSKGLKALKRIKDGNGISYKDLMECFDIIEKELKAFKIIKNENVNIDDLYTCIKTEVYPLQMYNEHHKKLTQEEYDLLKEVLL